MSRISSTTVGIHSMSVQSERRRLVLLLLIQSLWYYPAVAFLSKTGTSIASARGHSDVPFLPACNNNSLLFHAADRRPLAAASSSSSVLSMLSGSARRRTRLAVATDDTDLWLEQQRRQKQRQEARLSSSWSRPAPSLSATSPPPPPPSSSSNPEKRRLESPFGVRRRVRRVLQRARERTGVTNESFWDDVVQPPQDYDMEDDVDYSTIAAFDTETNFLYVGTTRSLPPTPSTTEAPTTTSSSVQEEEEEEGIRRVESLSVPSATISTGEVAAVRQVNGAAVPSKEEEVRASPNNISKATVVTSSAVTSSKSTSTSSSSKESKHKESLSAKLSMQTPTASPVASSATPTTTKAPAAVVAEETAADAPPLPFDLPILSAEQEERLEQGERIQEQSKMGREGSGYVVWDLPAPPEAVWECLLNFETYPQTIGTVRSMRMYENRAEPASNVQNYQDTAGKNRCGIPRTMRGAFVLSKFRFSVAAIHRYTPHPKGDYMIFTLDPASQGMVLQNAKGIWYTEKLAPNKTRVWLLCELKVSVMLPVMVVDYAARRAMPRATTWLKPTVEDWMIQNQP